MAHPGFFELRKGMDPLHKLEWDYVQLQQDTENVYLAYNFFVTAENMPEWMKDKTFKHKIQQEKLLLTLVNELATGAKHMTSGKKKPAIDSAKRDRYVAEGYVKCGDVMEPLVVRLSTAQAAKRGQDTIDVFTLAGEVPAFWQQYLQAPPSP
jgi:hypothetical protein